jgi:nucleotide-binding universal stress UspA family protein
MHDEIIACLDGSARAEAILPLARAIAKSTRAGLTLLRVTADTDELKAEQETLREHERLFGARVKSVIAPDPAAAILEELRKNPAALPALTSHGRTALMEAALGSVALKVVRGAGRPVLVYRPQLPGAEVPRRIEIIVVPLDGSAFSEKIIPYAVDFAGCVGAKIILVQALEFGLKDVAGSLPRSDISESAYLQSRTADIKRKYRLETNWDVLHGEPAEAICRFVEGMPNTMLALTSHARTGLERAFLGSVAAACVRHSGVPVLLYWPRASGEQ